ncbi:MAG: sulfite exporter TauE/SafE family protein [Alphaproteobacteria bacterium]|nr:sulfite exporter TauE/SafE family protein [Alphaproteobacteria bacterium]MBU4156328.1 sulfite exporter TauE/SafE family protein [Alphaproteobacteria bacterium]
MSSTFRPGLIELLPKTMLRNCSVVGSGPDETVGRQTYLHADHVSLFSRRRRRASSRALAASIDQSRHVQAAGGHVPRGLVPGNAVRQDHARDPWRRPADCLAGLIGGAMAGLGGLSGPVPAFWTSLKGLDKRTQRDVIQNFNLVILATTLAAYLATGIVRRDMVPMIAVLIPAGLIPTYIGSRLFPKVPELHFRQLILVLLTFSGGTMLVSTMFQG